MAILCREMHWTYKEYLDQPVNFITILLTMLQAESKARKNQEHKPTFTTE